jgi:cupin fold WbuC family metalloprotein
LRRIPQPGTADAFSRQHSDAIKRRNDSDMSDLRLALDPPQEYLALLTSKRLDDTLVQSRKSPRRRIIAPLHRSLSEPLHRMLNAIQPGSYVRPHRHLDPPKAEAWIVLRGAVLFVTFFDDGAIADHVALDAESDTFGVDLVPGHYHMLAALRPDTIIYEVKTGPYEATTDKSFAPWAPEEGTVEAQNYLHDLLKACGQEVPSLSQGL